MGLGAGELYKQLQKEEKFGEALTSKYIAQLAAALKYCHQKHVIHRSVASGCVLLTTL